MKLHQSRPSARAPGRQGFTFIELLVVMAIALIIIGISAAAAARMIATRKVQNSRETVQKVAASLQRQWTAVIDNAKDDTYPNPQGLLDWAGGDSLRARVMWIKLKLRAEFPTSYAEAMTPPTPPTNPSHQLTADDLPQQTQYGTQLGAAGVLWSTTPAPEEGAVCLLMALSIARRGAAIDTNLFGRAAVVDSSTAGIRMLVDGWGQPLGFFRWPWGSTYTASIQLGASTKITDLGPVDPVDPQMRLLDPTWNNSSNAANITAFEQAIGHPIHQMIGGTWTPVAYAVWPMVVSGGPDRKMGLGLEGWSPPNLVGPPAPAVPGSPATMADDGTGAANDNIYSFKQ